MKNSFCISEVAQGILVSEKDEVYRSLLESLYMFLYVCIIICSWLKFSENTQKYW